MKRRRKHPYRRRTANGIRADELEKALKLRKNVDTLVHPFGMSLGRHIESAMRLGLTSYDAAYAKLASMPSLTLRTADRRLEGAAQAATVPVVAID